MEQKAQKLITTVTLPPALRVKLDAEAVRQQRSRSWITAEAIKAYLERLEAGDDR